MAFELLKTDYRDDILNTSVNQLRRYTLVNNADGSISLIDITSYSTTGTFIGAKDINTMCRNMNTIMGYIETSSGDLAQEFQEYFDGQKGIFEDNVEAYMQDFQASSQSQFTVWFDANTAAWSQEVENRINAIIASLTELVNDNGPFVLNRAYKVGNLLTWNIGDGITRGYLVINPVPANMGIYPSNSTYFMEVTREGAQGVGLGLTPRGNWRNIVTYVENDWVVHNWIYWWCKVENTDSEPSESNSNWEKIYDITAEMPIQFEDYTGSATVPSFNEAISSIKKGRTLGGLLSNIKAAMLRLANKFKDTELTATGSLITYDSTDEAKGVITNISGNTSGAYISVANKGINYMYAIEANTALYKANARTNFVTIKQAAVGNTVFIPFDIDPIEAVLDCIFKVTTVSGSVSGDGDISFKLLLRNSSGVYEEAVNALEGATYNRVEFTNLVDSPSGAELQISVGNALILNDIIFCISLSPFYNEIDVNGVYVPASFSEPVEIDIYAGKNTIVSSAASVIPTVEFKSRFYNINKRITSIDAIINNTINNNTSTLVDASYATMAQISGEWSMWANGNFHNGDAMAGSLFVLAGQSTQHTFTGYGIVVHSFKGTNQGIMGIYLDDAHVADVDLYSAVESYDQVVYSVNNLEYGAHTIKFVKTGNKNASATLDWVTIDYLDIITGGDLLTPRLANNLATNKAGFALGAQMGPVIDNRLNELNDALTYKFEIINISGTTDAYGQLAYAFNGKIPLMVVNNMSYAIATLSTVSNAIRFLNVASTPTLLINATINVNVLCAVPR